MGLLLAGLGLSLLSWLGREARVQQAQALWSDGPAHVQRCDVGWGRTAARVPLTGLRRWG